jgi:hypothetical protein
MSAFYNEILGAFPVKERLMTAAKLRFSLEKLAHGNHGEHGKSRKNPDHRRRTFKIAEAWAQVRAAAAAACLNARDFWHV